MFVSAALILADAEVEISADNLISLTKAANVSGVEPIWAQLFAKAVNGQNITDLLSQFSAGGSGPAAAVAGGAAAGGAAAEEAVEEEEEAKEESDDDMGFGLFD